MVALNTDNTVSDGPPEQFTGTPGTGTTATPKPDTTLSIQAFIEQYFGTAFGGALQDEMVKAYQKWLAGYPAAQILYDIRQSDAYAARFAGVVALRKQGYEISEAAALDLERQYTQLGRQFDLPPGFITQDLMQRWIGSQSSPVEVQARLTAWQTYERETRDPAAEAAIRQQFAAAGLVASEGDFLAAVIDPERSVAVIEQRLNAGIVSGAASRSGFGALTVDEGLTLADRGVTRDQAEQGFGLLADSTELFDPLAGEAGADTIGRESQIGALFQGDSAARRRIERQRDRRLAEFSGGSGGGLGRSGVAGLGGG